MNSQIIKDSRLAEEYLRVEHPSGLTMLLYPMKGFSTAYAMFSTKYGSIDTCFQRGEDADFVKVPEGIATRCLKAKRAMPLKNMHRRVLLPMLLPALTRPVTFLPALTDSRSHWKSCWIA